MPDFPLIWQNGDIIRDGRAMVPAHSQGVLWGRGVFETIGVFHGRPFALTRHLERMRQAAARLHLLPPDDDFWRAGIESLLTACPMENARLRLTLSGGEHPGLELKSEGAHSSIILWPLQPIRSPARLLTVPWRRNDRSPLAGVKCTSYAENALALHWAQARFATEACFLDTLGNLSECAASNLFLIKGNQLITPWTASGCLPGITRSLVLEISRQTLGLNCEDRSVPPAEVASAEALFLTSSLRGIQPVSSMDGRIFPVDHAVSSRLSAAYDQLILSQLDP